MRWWPYPIRMVPTTTPPCGCRLVAALLAPSRHVVIRPGTCGEASSASGSGAVAGTMLPTFM